MKKKSIKHLCARRFSKSSIFQLCQAVLPIEVVAKAPRKLSKSATMMVMIIYRSHSLLFTCVKIEIGWGTWSTRAFFCRSTKSHKHQSSTARMFIMFPRWSWCWSWPGNIKCWYIQTASLACRNSHIIIFFPPTAAPCCCSACPYWWWRWWWWWWWWWWW